MLIDLPLCDLLAGRPICVHASMRAFDPRADADALLDVLLDLGCTVLMPTFSYAFEQPPPAGVRPARNGMDYDHTGSPHSRVFDASANELSRSDMGALPAALLERNRVRGDHPLNSFAATGPLAADLIGRQSLQNVYGPFEGLIEHDGLVVLAGVGCTSMTLIHYAEQQAGRAMFQRWAKDRDSTVVACATGSCSMAFGRFDTVLSQDTFEVSGSTWRVMDASTAADQAKRAIMADPAITHCGRAGCQRCHDAVAGGPLRG